MRPTLIASLSAAAALLAACGSSNAPPPKQASSAPADATVVVSKGNVFSPLVDDLNKAKMLKKQSQGQVDHANTDQQIEPAPAAATANDASNPP
jgi:lipoprotein-anchoring transpeptidase ErfK/SrfK